MARIGLTLALAAGFAMAAAGCLVVGGKEIEQSGVKVTGATLGQIEPGVTNKEWLLATLGEPTSRTTLESDSAVEIFKYHHRVRRAQGSAVFLIFAGGSDVEEVTTTYFELRDGVVTKYWTES